MSRTQSKFLRTRENSLRLEEITHKAAFSVVEFCLLHNICRATFVNYERAGVGPRLMRVGGRVLVSREAAEAWRRQLETSPLPKRGRPRKDTVPTRNERGAS